MLPLSISQAINNSYFVYDGVVIQFCTENRRASSDESIAGKLEQNCPRLNTYGQGQTCLIRITARKRNPAPPAPQMIYAHWLKVKPHSIITQASETRTVGKWRLLVKPPRGQKAEARRGMAALRGKLLLLQAGSSSWNHSSAYWHRRHNKHNTTNTIHIKPLPSVSN